MSDVSTPAQTPNKGRHYEFIKNTTSDTFKSATLGRGLALAATPLKMQPWYSSQSGGSNGRTRRPSETVDQQ